MLIALVNLSKNVKAADTVAIAAAITQQLQQEYAQIWGGSGTMVAAPDLAHIPSGARPMFLLDKNPDPGALGDHEESVSGVPTARIFVPDILTAPGAGVTNGTGSSPVSVSSVVSHEALEMSGNPYINLWASGPDGYDHARELCDAVESSGYTKKITGAGAAVTNVLLSNFLTPRYFDQSPPANAKFDYLGHLSKPFSIERDGYEVVKPTDNEKQRFGNIQAAAFHFGADMPQWRRDWKINKHLGRSRRMAGADRSVHARGIVHVCNQTCCTPAT
jgi:hypothetical protein